MALLCSSGDSSIQFLSYGASKAAGNHLFKRLHNELSASEGFTVISFHPGLVATSFTNIQIGQTYGVSTAISSEQAGKQT